MLKELEDITIPNLSDEMIRRDNFFHTCWTLLKRDFPSMWEEMTKIELTVAGYGSDSLAKEGASDDDKPESITTV